MSEKLPFYKKQNTRRPTEYRPDFCEILIEHMSGGLSFESFAGVIGVDLGTMQDWLQAVDKKGEPKYPEFIRAKAIAVEKCRLYWEKMGIEGLWNTSSKEHGSRSFNSAVWAKNMKCRFSKEWGESVKVEHSGHTSSDVKVKREMNDKELMDSIKKILGDGV